MNLTGLFQYGNKDSVSREGQKAAGREGSVTADRPAQQAVKHLTPGQTIQGEVIGKNGNEIQIRVDKDVVINARLDRDMQVSTGQNMTFEVKNNSGSQVALSPLYENMAQDVNVLKALEAAKLPATKDLMQMVSAMMKQGMSIDKNALLDMSKLIYGNAAARPETIVTLKALNIPVTSENISQFENYERCEHQLLKQISDILTQLPDTYHTLTQTGQGHAAVELYMQVTELLAEGEAGAGGFVSLSEGQAKAADQVFVDQEGNVLQQQSQANTMSEHPRLSEGKELAAAVREQVQSGLPDDWMRTVTAEGRELNTSDGMLKESVYAQDGYHTADNPLIGVTDAQARAKLSVMLERLGLDESMSAQIRDGSMSPQQFMKALQQLFAGREAVSRTDLMQLFESREYHQVLEQALKQQWLLKPEEVADKELVEEFYGRLKNHTARLLEGLGQLAKDAPLAQNLTNMQNNLDFMNQMNHTFQYIQLPLKLSGGEAHGDLYVYTNRRNKSGEDDTVSALLHLDMEQLGTMDIHVKMKDRDVSTRFYLQNEEMIDFISQHIHILSERLQQKGYSMQAQMQVMQEDRKAAVNVMENIMAQEKKSTLLAQYSFDVRA